MQIHQFSIIILEYLSLNDAYNVMVVYKEKKIKIFVYGYAWMKFKHSLWDKNAYIIKMLK